MSTMPESQERFVRQAFKYFNRFMLLNWRLGLGPLWSIWPQGFGRYLVLIHTGRKSGLERRTPVNFVRMDGDYYITAGFGKKSHWYRNIIAQPQIDIWTPDGWWRADAQDITNHPDYAHLMREVLKNSGFASFAAGINPYRLSDAELVEATRSYRLLRLHPTEKRSGQGGPGDLAWVWPVSTAVLLILALVRKQR